MGGWRSGGVKWAQQRAPDRSAALRQSRGGRDRDLSAEPSSDCRSNKLTRACPPEIVCHWRLRSLKQGLTRSDPEAIQAILASAPRNILYRLFCPEFELLCLASGRNSSGIRGRRGVGEEDPERREVRSEAQFQYHHHMSKCLHRLRWCALNMPPHRAARPHDHSTPAKALCHDRRLASAAAAVVTMAAAAAAAAMVAAAPPPPPPPLPGWTAPPAYRRRHFFWVRSCGQTPRSVSVVCTQYQMLCSFLGSPNKESGPLSENVASDASPKG